MYLNELGGDNARCYYCRFWKKQGRKNICDCVGSDYCTDWTEESFGCDAFKMRELTPRELMYAKKDKKDGKGNK